MTHDDQQPPFIKPREPITVSLLVRYAVKGHLPSAWLLIDLVAQDLADSASESEVAGFAAAFFAKLYDRHDDESDDRADLKKSLGDLNLLRQRGRSNPADFDAAWRRIEDIARYLAEPSDRSELRVYATQFFEHLADLHRKGTDTPRHLVSAFETLNLIRPRGRPERDSFETAKLAARVIMIQRIGYSIEQAAWLLDNLKIEGDSHSESVYLSAYYEIIGLLEPATDENLEIRACISSERLRQLIRQRGRSVPNKPFI